jgi:hypothetical protein
MKYRDKIFQVLKRLLLVAYPLLCHYSARGCVHKAQDSHGVGYFECRIRIYIPVKEVKIRKKKVRRSSKHFCKTTNY